MGGSTNNYSFPYPYADEVVGASDVQDLAQAIDTTLTNWNAEVKALHTQQLAMVAAVSTPTSIPLNTTVNPAYDTVVWDPNGIVNLGADNQHLHVPSGLYWVTGAVGILSSFTENAVRLSIIRNGTAVVRQRIFFPSSDPVNVRVAANVYMSAAGQINLSCLINGSGGPFNVYGRLGVVRLRGPEDI